jgi:soluble lytic murein transglycosylase-like protein
MEAVVPADPAERGEAPKQAGTAAVPSPELRTLIDTVARRTQVAPALLHAVIYAESRYDPNAVSSRGAIGLMQLLPETGKRFGARNLFSASENVTAGANYLSWLMTLFDRDLELVLAAFNAGEQAVLRAGKRVPPYPETQAYVKGILARLAGVGSPVTR